MDRPMTRDEHERALRRKTVLRSGSEPVQTQRISAHVAEVSGETAAVVDVRGEVERLCCQPLPFGFKGQLPSEQSVSFDG